uniref:Uncharacterized protein n=1 Tax=Oryza rufipogon TaxID=4529 RepID=A0A0E0QIJ3_ORYRU
MPLKFLQIGSMPPRCIFRPSPVNFLTPCRLSTSPLKAPPNSTTSASRGMVSGLDFGLLNSSRPGPIRRGAAVKTGTRVFADSRTSTPPPSSRRLPRRTRPNRRRGCYLMQLDEGCLWLACRQLWDDGLGWKLDMTGCCCFKMNGPTTENDAGDSPAQKNGTFPDLKIDIDLVEPHHPLVAVPPGATVTTMTEAMMWR